MPSSSLIAHAGESLPISDNVSNFIVEDLDAEGISFHVRFQGFKVWAILSLDEDRFALGCGDGVIRIVSCAQKAVVKEFKHVAPKRDKAGEREDNIVHNLACDTAAVSPGILVSASRSGVVHVWDKKTLERGAELLSIPDSVAAVSVSEKYVVASCYDCTVRVFLRSGGGLYIPFHTIHHHKEAVTCVCVVPGSDFVLSAGQDGFAYATDVQKKKKGWKANLRMNKKSVACSPHDILLLHDGSIAVPVLEEVTAGGTKKPAEESIELRIWKKPNCLPALSTEAALVVDKDEACGDGEPKSTEKLQRRLAVSPPELKRKSGSASAGNIAPQRGAVRDFPEGKQSKRQKSAANISGLVANAPTLPRRAGGPSDLISVPVAYVAEPPAKVAVSVDGGSGVVAGCKPEPSEARSRGSGIDTGNATGSPPGKSGGSGQAAPIGREPIARRVTATAHREARAVGQPAGQPQDVESLLKRWSENRPLRGDVLEMGQKKLASALAGYMLDFEFSRLDEFKVLERVLRGSFSSTRISNSSLGGKFGLQPETFVKLVKEGVRSLVANGAEDETSAFWPATYDAAVANLLNTYFKN